VAKECRKCKDYRDCQGHIYIVEKEEGKEYVPWYHYGEIRFCPFQIRWIIEHAETLRAKWPDAPEDSGCIDPGIQTGYKSEAYYTKPAGILGEVNARLTKAGTHGKLLRAEVLAELDLSEESTSALMYCKGWRRKRISYQRWLWARHYEEKKVRKTT